MQTKVKGKDVTMFITKGSSRLLIFILAVGVFGILNTEMGVVGIIPQVSERFGVSVPDAGLLVSGFALIVAIATEGDEEIKKVAQHVIYIPKVRDCFTPITASVPLQLFARSIALLRGCDVDQPRNLAKSVTVE